VTPQELYNSLDYVNHSRAKRKFYAELVIDNPHLMKDVLDIVFQIDDPISCRAAWVAEFVCKTNLAPLYDHLDYFTEHMQKVHQDSAVRPVAKICEYLCLSYFKQMDTLSRKHISNLHKERITEACFDWLITEQKVAPKAYSLTSLFYLGTEYEWIHPELHRIMEDDYHKGSAAYKARCRHMFENIKKFNKRQH